ncbi:Biopolymer transport protein ExbD [Candidatus Methylobacter favarea]|uniref:Biopolymer transport protein ExbD n=1 Tax=Candidatus Methylobacter favarea TaxID=2707345 RepID=A0A8S0WJZ8_9GAMM|nr:biopolymer transporter ExbD [Candidatus Methylobacter favarea]CAA9891618.1 Biopolymer transport protein ExbD [Candidatus Methylobacter favarea]
MNFRRKKREKLDITLISMIDVLFVLLLFFMVSTTFNRNTEVNIKLPEAAGADAEEHPKMVTLTIDADGSYYLQGDDGLPHELVNQNINTLKQELHKLAEHSGQLPFIINADGKTPHQSVISALEAAGDAGFSHITFAAQHSKTGK